MTAEAVPTRSDLLSAIRASGEEVLATLRALPPEHFEHGRYENGWNGRGILAHIASIEWTYPRLLDIAREAATARERTDGLPTRSMQGGNDAYNARQVEKRAGLPVAALIEEFERNRVATVAAVESADEALLVTPIRSAGGVTGSLALVLQRVVVDHVRGHLRDITG